MFESNKIVKNILWLLYSKFFSLVLNLLVTVKIIDHFASKEYGMYSYAVSVVAILEILVSLIEVRIVKKKYAEYPISFVIFNSTVARMFLSIFSFIIGIVFISFYRGSTQFNIIFLILLFNSIVTNLRFGIENYFEYNLDSKKTVIISNVVALLTATLQFVAISLNWSIVSLCIISSIGAIVSFVLAMIFYKINYKEKFWDKINLSFIKTIINESIPLAWAAAAAIIYSKFGSIIIEHYLSYSDVGVYAVSLKLYSIVQIGLVPVRTSFFPKQMKLYQSDRKKYRTFYTKVSSAMTWFSIAIVICSITLCPIVFNYVFKKAEYAAALPAFNILLIGVVFMYNTTLRTAHYAIIGKQRVMAIIQTIAMTVNILFNLIFVKKFGIQGAAISTVITQILSLFVMDIFFKDGREVFYMHLKAFNPSVIFKK